MWLHLGNSSDRSDSPFPSLIRAEALLTLQNLCCFFYVTQPFSQVTMWFLLSKVSQDWLTGYHSQRSSNSSLCHFTNGREGNPGPPTTPGSSPDTYNQQPLSAPSQNPAVISVGCFLSTSVGLLSPHPSGWALPLGTGAQDFYPFFEFPPFPSLGTDWRLPHCSLLLPSLPGLIHTSSCSAGLHPQWMLAY